MTKYTKFDDILKSGKKYKVILADPPWDWKTWSDGGKGRSASQHYDVMPEKELYNAFDVNSIADKNAVLFMWVTPPNLEEGLRLINKWGFKYKTKAFNWVKINKKSDSPFVGMGYYTRANPEDCLLATKGKPLPRQSCGVQQLTFARIGRHSEKPVIIHHKIEQLFGDLPRIELFARQEQPGWDAFGNEL